jgi:hypothetical protein
MDSQLSAQTIGILAYGSLIREPGVEIEPLIARRIPTVTPFPVEYARLSQSRGGGPTVVPHPAGRPVSAEILVLRQGVSLDQAKDLLWRRELRKEGTGRRYVPGNTPNSVLVKDWGAYEGVAHVLYTDFPEAGKVPVPTAESLAQAAVASVAEAPVGKDGISYLLQLIASGVETALTADYLSAILRLTGADTLQQALKAQREKIGGGRAK